MNITISTIPFLVLILIAYVVAKKQLLPVLMFMTVFQGAALVIIGNGATGLALAPAQVVLVLLIIQKMFQRAPAPFKRPQAQTSIAIVLLAYGSYAMLSIIFFPYLFRGILVINPRNGMGAPLTWSMYNVTQGIYLLLGLTVFLICAYRSSAGEIKRALDWYLAGATFAGIVALYQFIAFSTGLPFPSEILHSNTQYTIFEAYEMNGYTRVNATFTEAAAAAGCFSAALGLVLYRALFLECTWKLVVSLIVLFTGLILTRSTTGYLGLAFILAATSVLYLKKTYVTQKVNLFRNCLGVAVLAVGLFGMFSSQARSNVNNLLDTVLFTKTKSSSFEERSSWNNSALNAGAESWWLGTGWGSLRASSLAANILGTVGIPGLLMFTAFVGLCVRFAITAQTDSSKIQKSAVLPLLVFLIDCLVAGPEMTDPVPWFLFGAAAFAFPIRPVFRPSDAGYFRRGIPT